MIAVSLSLLAVPALAQSPEPVPPSAEEGSPDLPPSDSEAQFQQAMTKKDAGDWVGARDVLTRLVQADPSAKHLYWSAVAHRETGNFVEAIDHFRASLSSATSASPHPDHAGAEQALIDLEPTIGSVRVTVSPIGLENLAIFIDDKKVPSTDLGFPHRLNPGTHVVRVEAPGRTPVEQTVQVAAGQSINLPMELDTPGAVAPVQRQPIAEGSGLIGVLGTGLVIGGGASVAIGLVVGIVAVAQVSSAEAGQTAEVDSARDKALAADLFGAIGLAAIIVGGVTLLNISEDEVGVIPAGPVTFDPQRLLLRF